MFKLRDGDTAKRILRDIKALDVNCKFMHVCGTHQDTMVRFGLEELLMDVGVEIRQGPGCPVCVTTSTEVAAGITLARSGKTVCVFGDMMKVPTTIGSLNDAKADGADVRIVYSIEDAVRVSSSSEKDVVFMSVGFETTAPTTAVPLNKGVPPNFSVYSCHRIVPPALEAIFEMGEIKVDGFIQPGHVSVITGLSIFEPFSLRYKMPQVVAGFEPLDLLMASYMLAKQVREGRAEVENEYSRLVKKDGNPKARELLARTFRTEDRAWRGFPVIKKSALALKSEYEDHDASKIHEDILKNMPDVEDEPKGCRCGEVLRGLIRSEECPMFGKACDPNRPMGPCMVSHEGSCNIAFRFSGQRR
ncbi:MAG: hydrogenase formation protein HypD [Methanomassiliicoccaceae archaeon]|jgi:hydrogenase expression/formation protein HypD|nr:hydrogenase formation protein HypD [Methanomassiliicoccaceae archaeon]